jgi:alpha-ketoglutarate-dependent taurine dioxygenase
MRSPVMSSVILLVHAQSRYAADSKEAMQYVRHPILDQETEHPVVRTNPDSGRKGLYVNSMFTYRYSCGRLHRAM